VFWQWPELSALLVDVRIERLIERLMRLIHFEHGLYLRAAACGSIVGTCVGSKAESRVGVGAMAPG
jgi:hypothetical protein